MIIAKRVCYLSSQVVSRRCDQYLHLRSPPLIWLSAVYRRLLGTQFTGRREYILRCRGKCKTNLQGLYIPNPPHWPVDDVFSAAPNVIQALSVIPSEAEESKPAIGSRGAIHVTKPRIEGRWHATAWLMDKVLRFLGFARNDSRVGGVPCFIV